MKARLAAVATAVLAVSMPLVASAGGRALRLDDYDRLVSVEKPALSPDGTLVAFVRVSILEEQNRRVREVWIAGADGRTPPARVSPAGADARDPAWSPDGAVLAWTSRPSGASAQDRPQVWFLDARRPGSAPYQVEGVRGAPLFSPDGRWIAFVDRAADPVPPAPPADEAARKAVERFRGHAYEWMNFRYDGRGYLPDPRDPRATPARELFLVPRDGGVPRALTRFGFDVQAAAWRPDGGALAVVADARQRDEHTYERADLWVVDLEGAVRRLTDDGHEHDSPSWSPDGRWIAVRRQQGLDLVLRARQRHGGPTDVFRIAADGSARENLTARFDLVPEDPAWNADGHVYFRAEAGGATHLFRARGDGAEVEPVTAGARRLGAFSLSRDGGRVAYVASDPTHPVELHVAVQPPRPGREKASIGLSDETRLTGFNDALLGEVALVAPERVEYRSPDGTPIEGWFLRPRDAAPPWPMVTVIHGGPHASFGWDFSFPWQLWAADGIAVLYTNPRGSTGYGEEFLWATWGGWGERDTEDVLAGVDHVLARHPVDRSRLGLAGYSYGGFLTNWILTRTGRFAAAAVGAGISNWISDYGTADIPRTKESEFGGPPWDPAANALLRRLSPIEHVAAVRTPTLFIHGERDFRVPIEQGEQMYTALRKRKVEARFVRYTEAAHGNWAPWDLVHRYHEELSWWRRWLRPAGAAEAAPSIP